ncbi:uncharacterized protein LOC128965032 [Oppia nitens]|uniref:uncharacterized protein LOC128965032 n=1 Tax=Oppia nitens TaxID=1686743 RepID=UPI0023DAB6B9|nr:uncharacterized protein LOC128965032 [Oppia nitens]
MTSIAKPIQLLSILSVISILFVWTMTTVQPISAGTGPKEFTSSSGRHFVAVDIKSPDVLQALQAVMTAGTVPAMSDPNWHNGLVSIYDCYLHTSPELTRYLLTLRLYGYHKCTETDGPNVHRTDKGCLHPATDCTTNIMKQGSDYKYETMSCAPAVVYN